MKIYHNPRCSKSRQTLDLLQQAGIDPDVVLYLDDPLGADELCGLIRKLGITPHALLRKGEAEYQQAGLSADSSDDAIIAAMTKYPKLIERPIVVKGCQAVLGRPPENVRALIESDND